MLQWSRLSSDFLQSGDILDCGLILGLTSTTADIDAIAGPFAIERTSIDTLENQRRHSSWFGGVAQPLEDEFRDRLPFRLRLIFPMRESKRAVRRFEYSEPR